MPASPSIAVPTPPGASGDRPLSAREVAPRFLLVFLPLAAGVWALALGIVVLSAQDDLRVVEAAEREHVTLEREIVRRELRAVAADLLFLAEGSLLRTFLAGEAESDRARLAQEWVHFAQRHPVYDQVRLLDAAGREVVRINRREGQAEIVPDPALQAKSGRYYVRETLARRVGEIFVSPFDLNVENGVIERPLKPTLRFSTPVTGPGGEQWGLVVFNFLGAMLFTELDEVSQHAAGEPWLVNATGHWLKGPDPAWEWGHVLSDRAEENCRRRFPELWASLSAEDRGQRLTDEGLFTFATWSPLEEFGGAAPDPTATDAPQAETSPAGVDRWKLISHVPAERLWGPSRRLTWGLGTMAAVITPMVAAGAWYFARARVRQEHAARDLAAAREQVLQSARLAAIGEAMTGLAHESRNALQRSQAGLALLSRRLEGQTDELHLLEEVREAQAHLHELYERTRDYAAPARLARRRADLAALARECWQHLEPRWNSRGLTLRVASAGPSEAEIDPLALAQVLRNVLENAIDASPTGADVLVEIQPGPGAHGGILLSVSDAGPGLEPGAEEQIFAPFFTTKARGTGLGLAIVRRLVEAHGGRVIARPAAGRGTRIVITLP